MTRPLQWKVLKEGSFAKGLYLQLCKTGEKPHILRPADGKRIAQQYICERQVQALAEPVGDLTSTLILSHTLPGVTPSDTIMSRARGL